MRNLSKILFLVLIIGIIVFLSVYIKQEKVLSTQSDTPPSADTVSTQKDIVNTTSTSTVEDSIEATSTVFSNKEEEVITKNLLKETVSIPQTSEVITSQKPTDDSKELIRKLVNFEVTLEELDKSGIDIDEVTIGTELTSDELVAMLNLRQKPYLDAKGFKVKEPYSSKEADFLIIASASEEVDMYLYSESGKFTGIVQFGNGGFGIPVEQVKGVTHYRYNDQGFMFSGRGETATMFLIVKQPTFARLYTRYGNDPNEYYYFPVSTHTKGSATVIRSENSVEVMHWNIDVDGDGSTDVSFGHEGPDQETAMKMGNLILNDPDLPKSEKDFFRQ